MTKFAMGYLGGANYPKVILRNHPEGWGAGFILNTNSPKWPKTNCWNLIEKLLSQSSVPSLKLHAMWEDNHTYVPKQHDKIILAEFDKAKRLRARHPDVTIYFSPLCERDNRSSSYDDLLHRINREGEGIVALNSFAKAGRVNGIVSEVHGKMGAPGGTYLYSTDGDQVFDMDIEALKTKHIDAEVIECWISMFNGKCNDKLSGEKGADTTKRNLRKAWPIDKHILSIVPYASERGEISWNKKWIYKTHADQHSKTKPAPREGKPVIIVPHKVSHLEFHTTDDRLIARFPRDIATFNAPGTPQHGFYIYRSASWGYEIREKAVAMHGSPLVIVKAGGKVFGKLNPAFRA